MIVPKNFRKTSNKPNCLNLFYEDLKESEKEEKNNLYTTSLQKTFQDIIHSSTFQAEQVKNILRCALEKNMIHLEEVKSISISKNFEKRFQAILFELI